MDQKQQLRLLEALLNREPVFVRLAAGADVAVEAMEFRGAEFLGWRPLEAGRPLIPPGDVVAVIFD